MNKELTFSEQVKEEISHLEYNAECAVIILFSIFKNNAEFMMTNTAKYYVISTQYPAVVRLIKILFAQLNSEIEIIIKTSNIKSLDNKSKYILEIRDYEYIDTLFNDLKYTVKWNHNQKRSYLLGAFLSSGSVSFSSTSSNYHFEIRSFNKEYLTEILHILESFNINSKIIEYRKKYKLYVKRSEHISDIIKLFNATETLYIFEDFRIQKDFSNSLQRMNNLDISNINKTIIASHNQIMWIQTIENKYAMSKLDQKAAIFCEVRKKYPEESLSSLSKIIKKEYNVDISRTSLNHVIRRIENLYKQIK